MRQIAFKPELNVWPEKPELKASDEIKSWSRGYNWNTSIHYLEAQNAIVRFVI